MDGEWPGEQSGPVLGLAPPLPLAAAVPPAQVLKARDALSLALTRVGDENSDIAAPDDVVDLDAFDIRIHARRCACMACSGAGRGQLGFDSAGLQPSAARQPITTMDTISIQAAATVANPGTADQILIDGTPTNGSNPWIDALVCDRAWADTAGLPSTGGDVTITYAFVKGTDPNGILTGQSMSWSNAGINAVSAALSSWENVANIDFVHTQDIGAADVWIWQGTASQAYGYLGWSEYPGITSSGRPLYTLFNGQDPSWSDTGLAKGGYGYVTAVHELGHLLGLGHPHDGGNNADANLFPGVDRPFGNLGDYSLNQGIYTAMSYNDGWQETYPTHSDIAYGWEATPMALDIAAIQAIYGARTGFATGNDTYILPILNAAGTFWSCIWDNGGLDAISNAGSTVGSVINLNAATLSGAGGGGFVSYASGIIGGYTIANGVIIENAIGGNAADAITGNSDANGLSGADGDDTLIGGNGNDTLDGGIGNDSLNGGAGDDTFLVDNASDLVTEDSDDNLGGLADTVLASVTYSLASSTIPGANGFGIENLTLTGIAAINGTGNTKDNLLVGNASGNRLDGGLGNDTLLGGAGADFLYGGLGSNTLKGGSFSDIYFVLNSTDIVTEDSNDATGGLADEVIAYVSFTLGQSTIAGGNGFGIENLTLDGSAVNATGNHLANRLTGNSNNNLLAGGAGDDSLDGGTGIDTMHGGAGNDTFLVDNAADLVTEDSDDSFGGLADTVLASVSYTLASSTIPGANGFGIENLTLTGNAAINATGNGKANLIRGNSASNTLDGGTGIDTMNGGAGNDTFLVDNAADLVTEDSDDSLGGLADTVLASVSFTLASSTIPGANGFGIENLTLTGTAAINATGNAKANRLSGNSANNSLSGATGNDTLDGAAGSDTMNGGGGDDTFLVDNNTDVVTEDSNVTAAGGVDSVQASVSYTLGNGTISGANGFGVENLNLTGSAAINGFGNALANRISGNGAANILDGGLGIDTLNGGGGNDICLVDNIADIVTEDTNDTLTGGIDTAQSSVSYSLGNGSAAGQNGFGIDNLTLTGTATSAIGNALANRLSGNSTNNVLSGAAGNDTLDGYAGIDTMNGGGGNDLFLVDNAADVVTEETDDTTGGLADTVWASISYTLGSGSTANANGFGIEFLVLTGTASISGTGNAKANWLIGNAAANTLDGGLGSDTMNGGDGNDLYLVDNSTDIVTENQTFPFGGDADTVQASVNYTLGSGTSAGSNGFGIENLILTGTAISATGNALANRITGNGANNVLSGAAGNDTLDGGAGIDTMNGGAGDDTILVDNAADIATEDSNDTITGGLDTVLASLSYTLGSGTTAGSNGFGIDHLTLTGTAALSASGNALANRITGNGANNVLSGAAGNDTLDGGAGIDTMNGGAGDDTFVVNDFTDVVTEATDDTLGGLADTVLTSVSYTLASSTIPGANGFGIENLTLTGFAAINATGNGKNNILTGNGANNTLIGNGGADRYISGAGADTIVLSFGSGTLGASSTATSTDWITDLTYLTDKIDLLTSAGGALAAPTSLNRMADNAVATSKDALATTMFTGLAANSASLCVATNAALAGRVFLAINDATAAYSSSSDLFLEVSGIASLPIVGTITVGNLFI